MENLHYKNDKLFILDQRLLPNEEKWIEIKNKEDAYEAIQTLQATQWLFFQKRMIYIN